MVSGEMLQNEGKRTEKNEEEQEQELQKVMMEELQWKSYGGRANGVDNVLRDKHKHKE